MASAVPIVSIIIPTHNRSRSLRRALDALCAQDFDNEKLEVIVVADGCRDDTLEMLRSYKAPFALHVVEQPGSGAAAARNQGAAAASGRLLLFLDDDIEPVSNLVAVHVRAHDRRSAQVVMGYSVPTMSKHLGFAGIGLRNWWSDKFRAMIEPGYRYTYRDLLSGNFSIGAELFRRLEGFDTALKGCEDYEFGARALAAGARFAFAKDAIGLHHEVADHKRAYRRKRHEGHADVLIGRRHPELRSTLMLARFADLESRLDRKLLKLAFDMPTFGDPLAGLLNHALKLFERARLRWRWRRLADALRAYWYWRGAADELGTLGALADFVRSGSSAADHSALEIEIDLREGLTAAERRLDDELPTSVCLRYGDQMIGRIPPEAGAEPLRGTHLRPALAGKLANPLLAALALEHAEEDNARRLHPLMGSSGDLRLSSDFGQNFVGSRVSMQDDGGKDDRRLPTFTVEHL